MRPWCPASGRRLFDSNIRKRARCPECGRRVVIADGRALRHRLPEERKEAA